MLTQHETNAKNNNIVHIHGNWSDGDFFRQMATRKPLYCWMRLTETVTPGFWEEIWMILSISPPLGDTSARDDDFSQEWEERKRSSVGNFSSSSLHWIYFNQLCDPYLTVVGTIDISVLAARSVADLL